MSITKTEQYLIDIVKSVLNDTEPEMPPEGVSPALLTDLAMRHSVLNIVGYGMGRLNGLGKQAAAFFDESKCRGMMQEARQEVEVLSILNTFEERKIGCMPLKGYIIKNLYPSVDMRTMCDCDILIKPENLDEAERIMRELGFNEREEGGHDISFRKPPHISIELHKKLINEQTWPLFGQYYSDIWERAKLKDGKKYIYEMTPEDFYIYMQVHTAKHYRSGGCGVRAVMDTYVFNRHYGADIDRERIDGELRKLEIYDFVKKFEELSLVWFGDNEETELSRRMTEYIMNGGAYGSKKNNDAVTAMRDEGDDVTVSKAMFTRYLRLIFVPYRNMTILYPFLKKAPFLLPFMWIYRIVNRMLFRRDKVKRVMNVDIDKETMDYLKKHYEEVGL